MSNEAEYDRVINKLISVEDKITDIDKIATVLDIWVRENDYELIPVMNILNNKIKEALKIIER